MTNVVVDEDAQAEAYAALLAPVIDEAWLAGAFIWRLYADPDDVSQEAEWNFSPGGKLAELVLRDAYPRAGRRTLVDRWGSRSLRRRNTGRV
jgi:hypothetical protein